MGGDDIASYVVALNAKLILVPPRRPHYNGHLHYLTANVYRRARIFDSDRFKRQFVQTLGDLRAEMGFRIVGYVLMPERCHLLIWPERSWESMSSMAQIMQKLSERTANFILRTLRRNLALPWCRKMLSGFELPLTVHHHAHYRVRQRGGYDRKGDVVATRGG